MSISNTIQLSYSGTCGTSVEASFHGTDVNKKTSSALPASPFQLVIRQKGVGVDSSAISAATASSSNSDSAVGDAGALELSNLINAWFTSHQSDETVMLGTSQLYRNTLIKGIYVHITYDKAQPDDV
jgi:hypothetical protein